MLDEIWHRIDAQDTFTAIEQLCALPEASEALAAFAECMRRAYDERRDLFLVIALGRAGIQYGLTEAARLEAADASLANDLRSRAKALAYNLGASTWPGWGDAGIVISSGELAVGLDAARTNLRLAEALHKEALPRSRAHWLLGAHLLAAGDLAGADEQFGQAVEQAIRAGEAGDEQLNRGYRALTAMLANPGDEVAAQGLEAAKAALAPLTYGDFLVGQLDTALDIFRKRGHGGE